MDMFDLASTLFGRGKPVAQGSTLTATGSAASAGGTAYLTMDADVTPAEGVGEDTDQTVIDVPTSPSVAEGDEVIMTLVGDGPLKTPVVMANPGFGDRMQVQVDNAETLAQQVEAIAQEAAAEVEQVRQDVADFRDDVATTYATKVERENGDEAVKTFITTNYTNSNDLATTYATKTLVSQTKDAIELAASQTYETQTDAAATYATKAALTVGLDGIRTEVAEDYQPKGDYATTASMNSAIQQSASSIESSVAATYETKSDAAATYATKTEVQQTAAGLDTRITTAQSTADGAYLERSGTGTTIDTTGAATIRSLVVEGQSAQDGTPTPSAPVPIVSVESRNLVDVADTSGSITNHYYNDVVTSFKLTAGVAYTLSMDVNSTVSPFNISVGCGNGTYAKDIRNVGGYTNGRNSITFTPTEAQLSDGAFLAFRAPRYQSRTTCSYTVSNIQLERGTTANPYQPYGCVTLVAGSTRTDIDMQGHALRSLPDGTRDEMAVDSLGRVTMTQRVGSVDMGTLTWGYNANGYFYAAVAGKAYGNYNIMCTDYAVASSDSAAGMSNGEIKGHLTSANVFAKNSVYSDAASFKAAVNGILLWYELATPQTIDLGTIDLPAPADTLWLDAAIVPTIGATWWTVGGIAGQQALDAEVTERQTLIRQFSGGVLAGYVGNAIAALVNAAGSFDVVRTAWTDGVPSILGTLARYAASGISLFDAAGNVLAEFASDHVRIGGNVPVGSGGTDVAGAAVQFFDQTDTHGSGIEAAMSLDEASDYYDMRSNVGISSQLADAERATDTGSTGNASLSLEQWMGYGITGTGEQFTETHSALVADSTYDGDGQSPVTSHARVSATATTGNIYANGTSYVELIADALGIGTNEGAIDYFTMDAVRSAFPVTLYDNASASASAAASLSETAANFSRLTIFYKDNDGNHSSADVWAPDGKRVALAITWISGASKQEMYQRVRWVTISGTSISTYKGTGDAKYRTGQVKLGATASVTNGDYISIVHVIGWR